MKTRGLRSSRREYLAGATMARVPRPSLDPEDTLRFYALRPHKVGMIKAPPKKILAEGTDGASSTSSRRS